MFSFVAICLSLLFISTLISCSSASKKSYKTWNEYTGEEKQSFILRSRSIQEEASTYALQRSLNISIKSNDIINDNEPIYTEKNKIPQMANRIERITDKIENIYKGISRDIQGVYLSHILREQLNSDTFEIFITDASIVDYILKKYEKDIKTSISTLLDNKYKENDLYKEWNGIFETYKLWRLSIDNIVNISNLKSLEEQNDIPLLETTTTLIFNKWQTELKIGENIAKIQADV